MKKTVFLLAIASITLLVLFGCTQAPSGEDKILIGWIGPLTGQSAVLGMDSATAAQIAIEEINAQGGVNGKKLELIVEDDQYDTAKSITAYKKLVEVDKVKIILINTYSSVFALAEQAKKDNVILIDPLDCSEIIGSVGENVYCIATDTKSIAQVLTEQISKSGTKKIGVLYANGDEFMPLINSYLTEMLNGQLTVTSESHIFGTGDFRTTLTKMKNAGINELVFLGYDETGIAMKQARDLNISGQFYSLGTITSPSLQSASQGAIGGTIFAFWEANKNTGMGKDFTTKFVAQKGRAPLMDLATYPTYDAVKVIAKALEGKTTTEEIKQAISGISGFDGATGIIDFNNSRAMKIKESAYRLKNGQIELVQ